MKALLKLFLSEALEASIDCKGISCITMNSQRKIFGIITKLADVHGIAPKYTDLGEYSDPSKYALHITIATADDFNKKLTSRTINEILERGAIEIVPCDKIEGFTLPTHRVKVKQVKTKKKK